MRGGVALLPTDEHDLEAEEPGVQAGAAALQYLDVYRLTGRQLLDPADGLRGERRRGQCGSEPLGPTIDVRRYPVALGSQSTTADTT